MAKKRKPLIYPRLSKGKLIDTHCHLDMAAYRDDLDEVLTRAAHHGVSRVISIGIDLASSERAVALAEKIPGVWATVGVHPHNVESMSEEDYVKLTELARHPRVVGFGETGMDLYYEHAAESCQIRHFARQVQLAKELDLPLVVHAREAHDQVMKILSEAAPYPSGGVMHCFSGDPKMADQVLELGFYLSIPGVVTFKKSELLREVVRLSPLNRMVLETDGPYLTPEPRRGRRNEPALMLFTAAEVAGIKGVALAEVARQTSLNAEELFSLPALSDSEV